MEASWQRSKETLTCSCVPLGEPGKEREKAAPGAACLVPACQGCSPHKVATIAEEEGAGQQAVTGVI